MIIKNELVIVIVTLFVQKLQAQYPKVNCPDNFRYVESGDEVVGIVTINDLELGENIIKIKLTHPGSERLDYIGAFDLNPEYLDDSYTIEAGSSVTYTVKFALENVIPTLTSIRVNDVKICSGRKVPAPKNTISWEHTIVTVEPRPRKRTTMQPSAYGKKATRRTASSPRTTTSPTTTSTTTTTTTTSTTLRPTQPQFKFLPKPVNFIQRPKEWTYINSVCGRENENLVKSLVVGGEDVERSRFPWIVALYVKTRRQLSFQCGGSLITTRTVISAAHCFHTEHNLIKEEDILVSVGRHEIDEWTFSDITVNSNVEKILRHPDYRQELENNDADLAIVQLEKSVAFTVYIRPVCMWEGVLDVHEIEGISGIVVGWGRNEDGDELTTTPKLARASVASETSCIKSNKKFIPFTSNRTLCAGNRDGSGPCSGDSGSGLMIKYRNNWSLRGIVSLSLVSETEIHGCNLQEYVVYTDIAQFLGWIYANSVF